MTIRLLLTATKVSEYVIALFRESDFIDRMPDEVCLQQVACVFASIPPVLKALDVLEQPLNDVRTWKKIGRDIL